MGEETNITHGHMSEEEINARLGMSEEELDRISEEYENGTWDTSGLGKVVIGRPRLANEETRAVTVRLPISQIAEIDRAAAREGKSRSSAIRAALQKWLDSVAVF